MGFLKDRRERKEAERHQALAAKRKAGHEAALALWESEGEQLDRFLEEARNWDGLSADEQPDAPVQLGAGERIFLVGDGMLLVEPRRERGTYQGGHAGVSFRVMKGVRLYTGGSRGTFVPGEEKPTPIDEGVAVFTNKRVVFQGAKQAREWSFAKLLGVQHDPEMPYTALAVSNRQKVSGLYYDEENAPLVRFRLELALAHHRGDTKPLIVALETDRAEHDATQPNLTA